MARGAHVRSVGSIAEFRGTFAWFADEARAALDHAESEIRRTQDWLERQRLPFWKQEILRRRAAVNRARSDLFRAQQMRTMGKLSHIDERQALERAQRGVSEAEAKLEHTRRAVISLERARTEYLGRASRLADIVDRGVPEALALLARVSDRLGDYLAAPPPGDTAAGAEPADEQAEGFARTGAEPVATDPVVLRSMVPRPDAVARAELIAEGSDIVLPTLDLDADGLAAVVSAVTGAPATPRELASLAPCDPAVTVAVGAAPGPGGDWVIERRMPISTADSGWRLVPMSGAAAWVLVPFAVLSPRRPALSTLLGAAPIGTMAVIARGLVAKAWTARNALVFPQAEGGGR